MGRRWTWGAAALSVVLAAGAVSAVPVAADPGDTVPLSVPGMAVSLAQAGELRLWGDNTHGQATVPASLAGVAISQVVLPDKAVLALTADGRVVGWGSNPDRLERVPAAVSAAKVAQIATFGAYAGAVTRDGRVFVWGKKLEVSTPLDVPAGLSGVKQLALATSTAIALKHDGSVVAWGRNMSGLTAVPAGLKATAVVGTESSFLALTEQGTVAQWGEPGGAMGMTPALQVPGNVKAIAGTRYQGLALLADSTLVAFGQGATAVPTEVQAVEPMLLANSGETNQYAVVDRDRAIHFWSGFGAGDEVGPPVDLNGRDITQIVLGVWNSASPGGVVIAKMLRAEAPAIRGAVKVGSVLTGVPGTFSATPDSVQSQWLVNGVPVPGNSPQLAVTAAMVGKAITYRSTASKAGETTVSSTSAGVQVPQPVVSSTTKVVRVKVAKKASRVVVTGKVSASSPPSGSAVVTIKKGRKSIVTKSVRVTASGSITLTVNKFAKLVVKKTKAKGKKAKTAHRGKYVVSIRYGGNPQVTASAGTGKFTVKR